jgi:hypothetical protein
MVNVVAVIGAFVMAVARQGAIQAVTEPVDNKAKTGNK